MNVLIPDRYVERVRAITDRGYLIIDGQCFCGKSGHEWSHGCTGVADMLPSPWVDLLATCQTCGGEGVDFSRCTRYSFPLCPDCVAGRPVHLLQATCPKCLPDHPGVRLSGGNVSWQLPDGRWVGHCWDCNRTGRVNLGRFTIQVMRCGGSNIEWDGVGWFYDIEHQWVYIDDSPHGGYRLILDPTPTIDQFVVALERQS